MKYVLGIDFGGGAAKATLLEETGRIRATCTVEYPTYHPTADACEQKAEDWLDALCKSTRAVLAKSGLEPQAICAVAVDSATHTVLPCDASFAPLCPAIHWTDCRSRAEAEALRDTHGEAIFARTFHKPDTIWTLPMLVWLKKTRPDVFASTRYLFFEKDFIRFFLTGVYATDTIEAEGSMLFDCTRGVWDEDLCRLAGITPHMLPPLQKPTDPAGTVTRAAAEQTGLCAGTPVITGTTDTALELFASGAVEKGDMTVKLATAGRMCVITDRPHPDAQLVNYSYILPGLWYPGTAIKSAAASYRWFRDTFGGDYTQLNEEAASVPVGCEGLFFHPYLTGELTPYADPMLRASFTGVSAAHGKAHFARAVLEGVAFALAESKAYLEQKQIPHKNEAVLIGGGAKGELWGQIVSDMLGWKLCTRQNSDSSLGSAMLAGIFAGFFSSAQDAAAKCVLSAKQFAPDEARHAQYRTLLQEYRAIHDALAPIYRAR